MLHDGTPSRSTISLHSDMAFTPVLHGAPLEDPAAVCFVCHDGRILVRGRGDRASLPRLTDLEQLGIVPEDPFQFGLLGHAPCFALSQPMTHELPEEWMMVGLRELVGLLDEDGFLVAGRGLQFCEWDRSHRHCGRCGAPTIRTPGVWSRGCTVCGYSAFPRISPAVIMLVHKEDACLLAHAAHHPEGLFSVLAGFLEPGETLEECVAREVREEVGLEVTDIRYFGNQPWPFPHSLMLGFTAAWASGEIVVDGVEILEAGWYTANTLPDRIPSRISIARRLLDAFFAESA